MHIPTTEQIERLNQIRLAIEGYKSKIIEAKEARKSIKDLNAEAKTILRGGPAKPRKPRAPKATTVPASAENQTEDQDPPAVTSADVKPKEKKGGK